MLGRSIIVTALSLNPHRKIHMYKSLRSAACLAVLACSAALASAATVTSTTYDFGFLGVDNTKAAVTFGSFVTNATNDITSVSGSFFDTMGLYGAISGLKPLNSDGGFNYDNQYNNGFDSAGMLFVVNGQDVNLYGEPDGTHLYTYFNNFGDITGDLWIREVSQTFAPEAQLPAVPEPSESLMIAAGLLGLSGLAMRRKARLMSKGI